MMVYLQIIETDMTIRNDNPILQPWSILEMISVGKGNILMKNEIMKI